MAESPGRSGSAANAPGTHAFRDRIPIALRRNVRRGPLPGLYPV